MHGAFLPTANEFAEGNVFTPVCHSTDGECHPYQGMLSLAGDAVLSSQGAMKGVGVHEGGCHEDPMPFNKRVVRILLEYILFLFVICAQITKIFRIEKI